MHTRAVGRTSACSAARDISSARANGVNISEVQCGYVARGVSVPLMQALRAQMQRSFLERVSVFSGCHLSKPEDRGNSLDRNSKSWAQNKSWDPVLCFWTLPDPPRLWNHRYIQGKRSFKGKSEAWVGKWHRALNAAFLYLAWRRQEWSLTFSKKWKLYHYRSQVGQCCDSQKIWNLIWVLSELRLPGRRPFQSKSQAMWCQILLLLLYFYEC